MKEIGNFDKLTSVTAASTAVLFEQPPPHKFLPENWTMSYLPLVSQMLTVGFWFFSYGPNFPSHTTNLPILLTHISSLHLLDGAPGDNAYACNPQHCARQNPDGLVIQQETMMES